MSARKTPQDSEVRVLEVDEYRRVLIEGVSLGASLASERPHEGLEDAADADSIPDTRAPSSSGSHFVNRFRTSAAAQGGGVLSPDAAYDEVAVLSETGA